MISNFSGIQQSFMYFNDTQKSWILQSLREKGNTFYQNINQAYPHGRMKWTNCERKSENDTCDEKKDNPRLLTFTSCGGEEEFTCDSGHCVDDVG